MKYKRQIFNILIILLCAYLIISGCYIFIHIDFSTPPEVVGMGFSGKENIIRNIMGLPSTYTTYGGVPPIYLVSSIIRIGLSGLLMFFRFKKKSSKMKKEERRK